MLNYVTFNSFIHSLSFSIPTFCAIFLLFHTESLIVRRTVPEIHPFINLSLPLSLFPLTFAFHTFFTSLSPSILSMCPNHLICSHINSSRWLSYHRRSYSHFFIPHATSSRPAILHIISIFNTLSLLLSAALTPHVSALYNTLRTTTPHRIIVITTTTYCNGLQTKSR